MNRNDIAGILAGLELTDAQVKGLLDLNSADITKALNRQKDDLTAANDALAKARETITALEANKADADALQKQIDDYKAADEKRKQEAQGRPAGRAGAAVQRRVRRPEVSARDGPGRRNGRLRQGAAGQGQPGQGRQGNL